MPGRNITAQGVSWPIIAIVFGVAVPLITGAITLGGVQQQVSINTSRVDKLERENSEQQQQLARLIAQSDFNTRRLDSIEESSMAHNLELARLRAEMDDLQRFRTEMQSKH